MKQNILMMMTLTALFLVSMTNGDSKININFEDMFKGFAFGTQAPSPSLDSFFCPAADYTDSILNSRELANFISQTFSNISNAREKYEASLRANNKTQPDYEVAKLEEELPTGTIPTELSQCAVRYFNSLAYLESLREFIQSAHLQVEFYQRSTLPINIEGVQDLAKRASPPSGYIAKDKLDYSVGNDMVAFSGKSVQQCADECNARGDCAGFAHNHYGSCWLKNNLNGETSAPLLAFYAKCPYTGVVKDDSWGLGDFFTFFLRCTKTIDCEGKWSMSCKVNAVKLSLDFTCKEGGYCEGGNFWGIELYIAKAGVYAGPILDGASFKGFYFKPEACVGVWIFKKCVSHEISVRF